MEIEKGHRRTRPHNMRSSSRPRGVLTLALVAASFVCDASAFTALARARPLPLSPRALRKPHSAPPPPRRAAPARMGFGGFNGGFLNLGAPEVIVIGAVAWAVLGPKELFRLAREAGEFLGQWQQLGQQARDQFTSALEQELAEDEATKKDSGAPEPSPWAQTQEAWGETSSPTSQGPPADSAPAPFDPAAPVKSVKYEVGSVPSLAEMAAQRAANNQTLTSEEEDALRASMCARVAQACSACAVRVSPLSARLSARPDRSRLPLMRAQVRHAGRAQRQRGQLRRADLGRAQLPGAAGVPK